ncbi:hypothetical protein HDR60_01685 [bacterium]|nr:hypothetical protein [bacterium]
MANKQTFFSHFTEEQKYPDKIKLNEKETHNLNSIKIKDVKKIIEDIHYVLDELYFDEKLAYLPYYNNDGTVIPFINPIEDIEVLADTALFVLDKYVVDEWEINEPSDTTENLKLFNALSELRYALNNAKEKALTSSRFNDVYQDFNKSYSEKQFIPAIEKINNKVYEQAGYIPVYNKGRIEYTNFAEYNGKIYLIHNIERSDGTHAPSTNDLIDLIINTKKGRNS